MDNLEDKIKSFVFCCRSRLLSILELSSSNLGEQGIVRDYKKTLLSALLDTMAKGIYPNQSANHKRFTRFIAEHAKWKDCEKVSLPHLARAVTVSDSPEFDELRRYVKSNFKWDKGDKISVEKDPDYEQILPLWPSKKDIKGDVLEQLTLVKFTHKYLLYANRNSLVHGLKERAYVFEDQEDSPFYSSVGLLRTNASVFNLVFPLRFYEKICMECINSMEHFCVKNKKIPYDAYIFGDYYYDELNKGL